jgi:hypothetical protein
MKKVIVPVFYIVVVAAAVAAFAKPLPQINPAELRAISCEYFKSGDFYMCRLESDAPIFNNAFKECFRVDDYTGMCM